MCVIQRRERERERMGAQSYNEQMRRGADTFSLFKSADGQGVTHLQNLGLTKNAPTPKFLSTFWIPLRMESNLLALASPCLRSST